MREQVVIEMYSMITVHAVRSELKLNSYFGLLIQDYQSLISSLEKCQCNFY